MTFPKRRRCTRPGTGRRRLLSRTALVLPALVLPALAAGVVAAAREGSSGSGGGAHRAIERSPGEHASVVQAANLVYAGSYSSRCFSDHFLLRADRDSTMSTSRRFHAVKLSSDKIFSYPFVIMTGEGEFRLRQAERGRLRTYLEKGGFLLASAGCSSKEWGKSFRAEVERAFPETSLQKLDFDHPVFHTVYDISSIKVRHGEPHPLEGLAIDGRLAIVYSADGLNDTGHVDNCCCCGGNEVANCEEINVNVLAYALIF